MLPLFCHLYISNFHHRDEFIKCLCSSGFIMESFNVFIFVIVCRYHCKCSVARSYLMRFFLFELADVVFNSGAQFVCTKHRNINQRPCRHAEKVGHAPYNRSSAASISSISGECRKTYSQPTRRKGFSACTMPMLRTPILCKLIALLPFPWSLLLPLPYRCTAY